MLGVPGVGKTSCTERFVKNIYSDVYHSTIGVKVDKKIVHVDGTPVTLIIWDLAGENNFERYRTSYLKGSSGYLFVVDLTCASTYEDGLNILRKVEDSELGNLPYAILFNKADLMDRWEISQETIHQIAQHAPVFITSAKTGDGVEEAFMTLASMMLQADQQPAS